FPLLQAGGINLPGFEQFRAESTVSNRQKNFTQEIRLQSTKPDARLVWQVGVFHARLWEHSQDVSVDPYLPQFAEYLFGKTLDDIWGVPQLPGFVEYVSDTVGRDTQTAVFADLTYSLTDQWKVNGGLRYTHARFSFNSFADGTLNFGRTTSRGEIEEKPLTPKVGVSFAPDRTQLYYVNAAKGFRIGGANPEFSFSLCQADLDELQLTSVPTSYDADTVWNYEAGARNAFLDGRVTTAMSVFRAEWSGIQQANFLPSCGFQYTANLGEAVSEGFDLQARARVSDAITVDAALGYTDARYSRDSRSGPAPSAPVIVGKGDSLGGAPWKAALGAQYDFLLLGTNAFARADYTFASAEDRGAEHDPRTTNYDPMLKPQPETHYVSVRAGTRTDGWNASFFVNNLFDAHPQLDLYHLDAYTELMEATTLRPRTIGVTLSYRR
ncbi:MAG: TonB-dependent receptor, partial [Hyphomonadaceae bacterium]